MLGQSLYLNGTVCKNKTNSSIGIVYKMNRVGKWWNNQEPVFTNQGETLPGNSNAKGGIISCDETATRKNQLQSLP
jgi:hypothetical protein